MTAPSFDSVRRLFPRLSDPEARRLGDILRIETVGGLLLLGATVLALAWANSPWHTAYTGLRDTRVGPAGPLHLDLTLDQWAADGLLALFFLVAGIELKREFVAGDLADRTKAVVPVTAALAGVALPAILYAVSVLALGGDSASLRGWAIPTATDIAFALAVLAVVGTHLPPALRAFLLTLAVVDDLIAITIIAIFYSADVAPMMLVAAMLPLGIWWWLLRRGHTQPFLLAVPAVATWVLVHDSGVHATVAGVLLGLAVPVHRRAAADDDEHSLAERIEHALRPWSAGLAVPAFAFLAAGVQLTGGGLASAFRDPITVGIVVGLIVGKAVGVFGGTWLVARLTRARLDENLGWADIAGLALLSGLGFTVSLLIGELAYGSASAHADHVRVAVLLGSLGAAVLAAIVLRRRNAHYRRAQEHDVPPGELRR
jgi:NhaA family Na+:H+ antiporter